MNLHKGWLNKHLNTHGFVLYSIEYLLISFIHRWLSTVLLTVSWHQYSSVFQHFSERVVRVKTSLEVSTNFYSVVSPELWNGCSIGSFKTGLKDIFIPEGISVMTEFLFCSYLVLTLSFLKSINLLR